jgi:hypothetical protein
LILTRFFANGTGNGALCCGPAVPGTRRPAFVQPAAPRAKAAATSPMAGRASFIVQPLLGIDPGQLILPQKREKVIMVNKFSKSKASELL